MIDLNKLERMLDEALEKETPESLTAWLTNQRIKNLLGNSSFEDVPSFTYSQKMSSIDSAVYIDEKGECDMGKAVDVITLPSFFFKGNIKELDAENEIADKN